MWPQKTAMMQSRKDTVAQQIHEHLKEQSRVRERIYGDAFPVVISINGQSRFYLKTNKSLQTPLVLKKKLLI